VTDPIRVFTVIALISLPTVMFGGFSLLRLLGAKQLTEFHQWAFRTGHAHAGVLLVLALVALDILGRSGAGTGLRWLAGALLLVGVLAQSGGFFLQMLVGGPGRWSPASTVSATGGALLAAGVLLVAYAVIVS
jgi:hypothetical protein